MWVLGGGSQQAADVDIDNPEKEKFKNRRQTFPRKMSDDQKNKFFKSDVVKKMRGGSSSPSGEMMPESDLSPVKNKILEFVRKFNSDETAIRKLQDSESFNVE